MHCMEVLPFCVAIQYASIAYAKAPANVHLLISMCVGSVAGVTQHHT
jgi:hypothetical protein